MDSRTVASGPSKRAMHVVYSTYPSDPRVRKEAETLANASFDVDVVCARRPNDPVHEKIGKVTVHRLPLSIVRGSQARYVFQYSVFFLFALVSILRLQLRKRFQVVHVHSLPDFLVFAALPAKLLGARIVLDLHESAPELLLARFPSAKGGLLDRLARGVQRASCRMADWVVTVNPEIARLLEDRACTCGDLTVIENAPDWDIERPRSAITELNGNPTLVIACGLNPERDLELVLQACESVLRRAPLQVRIIGDGDPSYVTRLRKSIVELGITSSVTVEGPVPHGRVREALDSSTFGVVSYQRSPITELATPNKAYEYAILSKPMVVADLAALRNLFGQSVLYYVPGDAASLADSMLRLVEDGELRAELSRRVHGAMKGHGWPEMTTRLLSVYADLTRPRGLRVRGAPNGSA